MTEDYCRCPGCGTCPAHDKAAKTYNTARMTKPQFYTVVFAPYTGTIEYTYKSAFHIELGEFAVVDTPTNGYQVVQVRSAVDEPAFQCKWLVQRVDLTEYKTLKAKAKPKASARI